MHKAAGVQRLVHGVQHASRAGPQPLPKPFQAENKPQRTREHAEKRKAGKAQRSRGILHSQRRSQKACGVHSHMRQHGGPQAARARIQGCQRRTHAQRV